MADYDYDVGGLFVPILPKYIWENIDDPLVHLDVVKLKVRVKIKHNVSFNIIHLATCLPTMTYFDWHNLPYIYLH